MQDATRKVLDVANSPRPTPEVEGVGHSDRLLNAIQVAERLALAPGTIRNLASKGKLPRWPYGIV